MEKFNYNKNIVDPKATVQLLSIIEAWRFVPKKRSTISWVVVEQQTGHYVFDKRFALLSNETSESGAKFNLQQLNHS